MDQEEINEVHIRTHAHHNINAKGNDDYGLYLGLGKM